MKRIKSKEKAAIICEPNVEAGRTFRDGLVCW